MPNKTIKLKIQGMHCAACEVLVERKWRKLPGIEKVTVDYTSGKVVLEGSREPTVAELQNAIEGHGYTVVSLESQDSLDSTSLVRASAGGREGNTPRDYREIGAAFLILMGGYLLLKRFGFVPQGLGFDDKVSYGVVFLTGLVASVSTCMAVTGGLLMALSSRRIARHPELTGFQKFKPHLYFNIGRIISYGVLGGVVGLIGAAIAPSARMNGFLSVIASLVMIVLGLQILKLFPHLARLQPRMPKRLAHKIHDLQESDSPSMPFILGALTFFLPCGFTQALQIYALSTGSFTRGGLTMFVFALATLPALLSIGALSSFLKKGVQRYFLKFAGVLVVMVGVVNINSGFTLINLDTGIANAFRSQGKSQSTGMVENIRVENGVQIAEMRVQGLEYYPSRFVVQKGVPVEWRIDGTGAAGCAQVITAPKLKLNAYLPAQGVKTVKFTPQETGEIKFSCSMGMTTPGAKFVVIEDSSSLPSLDPNAGASGNQACNPNIANCI